MKMKVFYLLALIILILGCWFSAILFGGILNPGTLIALAIVVALIAFSIAPLTQRVSQYVWVCAGLLILVALFLPTSFFEKFFPPGDAGPLTLSIAFTILIIISLALIITALLLNACQMLYKKSQAVGKEEDGALQEDARKPDRAVAIILGLSVLLLAKAHHSFYWFMVWDGTIDSLVILWLPITIMAVIFSSFMLYVILPGRTKRAPSQSPTSTAIRIEAMTGGLRVGSRGGAAAWLIVLLSPPQGNGPRLNTRSRGACPPSE